jgi:hypothetical protein
MFQAQDGAPHLWIPAEMEKMVENGGKWSEMVFARFSERCSSERAEPSR